MALMNFAQAVHSALEREMERDDRIVLLGDGVAGGGASGATGGLGARFGAARVVDAPAGAASLAGAALGMALQGARPIAELALADSADAAFDQLARELATVRWRTGGDFTAPVVVRAPCGGGIGGGPGASASPEALFAHSPGLAVVVPSNPYDAKGLLAAAARGDDPVLFFEPSRLWRGPRAEVPDEAYTVPLGSAKVLRPGRDVTLLVWGAACGAAARAAATAAEHGRDVELVDLRSLVPLDLGAIEASVAKTGRVVIVHEAPRTCGFGAELAALVAEHWIDRLWAPILRVTGPDAPAPSVQQEEWLPDARRILAAIEKVVTF